MTGHPRRVASRVDFEGRFLSVVTETFTAADGGQVEREIVRHPGAVAVVGFDGSSVLMVRQMRHTVMDRLLEIPAGKLDPGEDPWDTARRELEEETGFRCDHMELLLSCFTTPGFSDERMWIFLTDSLHKVSEPPTHDGDEPISVEWLALDEAMEAITDGRIVDAKTIIGLTMLLLRTGEEGEGQ